MKNCKLTQKGNDIKSPLLYDYMGFFWHKYLGYKNKS